MLLVVYLLCKVVYILDQASSFHFLKIKFENFCKPLLSCGCPIFEEKSMWFLKWLLPDLHRWPGFLPLSPVSTAISLLSCHPALLSLTVAKVSMETSASLHLILETFERSLLQVRFPWSLGWRGTGAGMVCLEIKKIETLGDPLAIQCLGLCAFTSGVKFRSLARIRQGVWHGQVIITIIRAFHLHRNWFWVHLFY